MYQGIGWDDDPLEEDMFLETEIAPESIDLKDTFFAADDVKDVDILE